jgi:hypothetical protein
MDDKGRARPLIAEWHPDQRPTIYDPGVLSHDPGSLAPRQRQCLPAGVEGRQHRCCWRSLPRGDQFTVAIFPSPADPTENRLEPCRDGLGEECESLDEQLGDGPVAPRQRYERVRTPSVPNNAGSPRKKKSVPVDQSQVRLRFAKLTQRYGEHPLLRGKDAGAWRIVHRCWRLRSSRLVALGDFALWRLGRWLWRRCGGVASTRQQTCPSDALVDRGRRLLAVVRGWSRPAKTTNNPPQKPQCDPATHDKTDV